MEGTDPVKGISQLLLSPLYLFRQILGTIVPGALLLLLLAHKGNPVLCHAWLNSPFGYKTNIAIFILLALVTGRILVIPMLFIFACKAAYQRIAADIKEPKSAALVPAGNPSNLNTETARDMLTGALTDGLILSTPGLMDRLSLEQSNAAFHIGTGCALPVAAAFPGDNLSWFEAVLGFAMLVVGIHLSIQYSSLGTRYIGIAFHNQVTSLTPQQLLASAAWLKAMMAAASTVQSPPPRPDAMKEPQSGQQGTVP